MATNCSTRPAPHGDEPQPAASASGSASSSASSSATRVPSDRHLHARSADTPSSSSSSSTSSRRASLITAGTAKFEPDASIVLTGLRGAGKSTLAVIAFTAMKRKVVEVEAVFRLETRMSSAAYKKSEGSLEYYRRQVSVLADVLQRHHKNAVIVCSWYERAVVDLLREWGTAHPVIHIVRDVEAIQQHLLLVADPSKVAGLVDATASVFRKCSRFEFFNISEGPTSPQGSRCTPSTDLDRTSAAPYMTLKRAERHFLAFLALIFPKNSIPFLESAFPLAGLKAEQRRFTYALSICLSDILAREVDIEEIETGADAIEIVVDDLVTGCRYTSDVRQLCPRRASEITRIVGHVRRNTVIPILYHVIFPDAATSQESLRSLYMSYVYHGLRIAAEYVSIDLRMDGDILTRIAGMKGPSRMMGNVQWTNSRPPHWRDPIWLTYYRKAQNGRCDLVRLTRQALDTMDNFEIRQIHAAIDDLGEPRIPTIAYNTGLLGRTSACFNHVLTSVAIADSSPADVALTADSFIPRPCLTAAQATQALYSSFVVDALNLYVFGASVSYSMSPAMHRSAFKACGIPHTYTAHSSNSIRDISKFVHDPRFGGASIGLPFKVEIISLTHSLSRHACAIGAVNTLIPVRTLNEDGSIPEDALLFNNRNRAGPVKALYGENTDWVGIRACLRRGLSPANAVSPHTCGLVVGAGGMARAAVYSMLQLGVKNIVIFNRTIANAEKLVAHFLRLLTTDNLPLLSTGSADDTRFHVLATRHTPWPAAFRMPTMIVSCIPTHSIGNSPSPDFTVPCSWLNSPTGGVVLELAYKSLNTPLLEQARREAHRGWVAMDGLDLLPEQGFAQFELFTGRRAPRRLMRREVLKSYPDDGGRSALDQLRPRLNNIPEQEP